MVEDYTLAPLGVLIRAQGYRLVAGIFTSFNGQPLTNGDHYLIIMQELNQISIHQPMGSDTSLTLPWPSIWQTNHLLQAQALDRAGNLIAAVPLTLSILGITFDYRSFIDSQEIELVRIADLGITPQYIFLPFVNR